MPTIFQAHADGTTAEIEVSEAELNPAKANTATAEPIETTGDEDELLSLVGETRDNVVVPKTVYITRIITDANGHEDQVIVEKPVLIMRLSRKESERLNQKRFRTVGGRITLDEEADINILAWQLHLCVVRNVAAPGLKPVYVPRWSLEQIVGRGARTDKKGHILAPGVDGLLDAKNSETEQLINQLQALVWECNPSQSPFLIAQALQSMGTL